MDTTTVRIREQDHKEIRDIAEQADATIPAVMSEVLDRVDLDEIRDEAGKQAVGACPECGAEIPAGNVKSAVLSGAVRAHCPVAERDDDVHEEVRKGQYEVTELDRLTDE